MAIHPVFVHFHTGILTAAAAVALVNLILRIFFRDNINTPGTRLARIFHQFDVFIYIGAFIGFLGLMAGMITGFMEPDYPVGALVAMPIMRFKILWSVVSTEIYLYLMIVRAKLGDRVWLKLAATDHPDTPRGNIARKGLVDIFLPATKNDPDRAGKRPATDRPPLAQVRGIDLLQQPFNNLVSHLITISSQEQLVSC